MPSGLSFCVVIPMFNEEAVAEKCVRMVYKALDAIPYWNALIIVNDSSNDETGSILARLKPEYNRLAILTHKQNAGYGGALKTGIKRAISESFDYVLFMDSDLTNDPKYIPYFVEKMLDGYDVIKASRYIHGGAVEGVPLYKVVISFIGNKIAKFLFGLPLTDCTNGFRAVKTNILSQMTLSESAFPIIMEELYHCKFLAKSFCEIPVTLTNRGRNQRPSSFAYRPGIFYRYLKYPVKSFLHIKPS